ncbi:Cytochrome P450 1A1 [Bienertia sinuspersici]
MADNSVATTTPQDNHSSKEPKSPNFLEKAKESLFHHKSPRHHKETHGTSDDINDSTPVDEIVGPSVFQRFKEEVEAIVGSLRQKKDSKEPK